MTMWAAKYDILAFFTKQKSTSAYNPNLSKTQLGSSQNALHSSEAKSVSPSMHLAPPVSRERPDR